MTKKPLYKPKVIQVSPYETLIVFPHRPGLPIAKSGNPPFDEIKHLLTDWPLRPPYRGEPLRKPRRKQSAKRVGKPRRSPKASRKRRRKPSDG